MERSSLLILILSLFNPMLNFASAQTENDDRKIVEAIQVLVQWEERHHAELAQGRRFDFSFLSNALAATGDRCLLPGYSGAIADSGSCKPISVDQADFKRCGSDQFPCNKDVFGMTDSSGNSICLPRDSSNGRWTLACTSLTIQKALGNQTPESAKKLANGALTSAQTDQLGRVLSSGGVNLDHLKNFTQPLCDSNSQTITPRDAIDCTKLSHLLGFQFSANQRCQKPDSNLANVSNTVNQMKKHVTKDCFYPMINDYNVDNMKKLWAKFRVNSALGAYASLKIPMETFKLGYSEPTASIFFQSPSVFNTPEFKSRFETYEANLAKALGPQILSAQRANPKCAFGRKAPTAITAENVIDELEALDWEGCNVHLSYDDKASVAKTNRASYMLLDSQTVNLLSSIKGIATGELDARPCKADWKNFL